MKHYSRKRLFKFTGAGYDTIGAVIVHKTRDVYRGDMQCGVKPGLTTYFVWGDHAAAQVIEDPRRDLCPECVKVDTSQDH